MALRKMKQIKVTVLKWAGETGLRKPGSSLLLPEKIAQGLAAKGIIELPKPKAKKKKAEPKKSK